MEVDSQTRFSISNLLGLTPAVGNDEIAPTSPMASRDTSYTAGGTALEKPAEAKSGQEADRGSYKKRYRATFDKAQIYQMERRFLVNHYPDVAARSELSRNTGLMESQVQIWFQNRRAKWRKQQRKRRHDVPTLFGLGYPSHLSRMYPSCESLGVFPYELYNTDFWACAQQQVAAMNATWTTTPSTKPVNQAPLCPVPLPESSAPAVEESMKRPNTSKTRHRAVEVRDDSSIQSLRLKAKEHLSSMEVEEIKQKQ